MSHPHPHPHPRGRDPRRAVRRRGGRHVPSSGRRRRRAHGRRVHSAHGHVPDAHRAHGTHAHRRGKRRPPHPRRRRGRRRHVRAPHPRRRRRNEAPHPRRRRRRRREAARRAHPHPHPHPAGVRSHPHRRRAGRSPHPHPHPHPHGHPHGGRPPRGRRVLFPGHVHLYPPALHLRAVHRRHRALRGFAVRELDEPEPARGAVRVAHDPRALDLAVALEQRAEQTVVDVLRERTHVHLRGVQRTVAARRAQPRAHPARAAYGSRHSRDLVHAQLREEALILAGHLRLRARGGGRVVAHGAVARGVPAVAADGARDERDVRSVRRDVLFRAILLRVPRPAAGVAEHALYVPQRAVDERELAQLRSFVLVEGLVHGLEQLPHHRRRAVHFLVRVAGDGDV